MVSITRHNKIWFAISGVFVIASIVALAAFGLNLGIDFRGGTLRDVQFGQPISSEDVAEELKAGGFSATVQPAGEHRVIIKTPAQTPEEQSALKNRLTDKFGTFQELSFEAIGPTIGRELVSRAYWQIALVSLGILLYVAYSFRQISTVAKQFRLSSWKLGMATIIALLHDITIPLGVFAFLGRFVGVEIDSLFITALLTILGFSVHDTIVVFDRIRESATKYPYKPLGTIIDYSVISTFARSVNTSSTLVFVLIASMLFGGATVFYFVFALLIGVVAGTYSSIFIASPILYLWQKR